MYDDVEAGIISGEDEDNLVALVVGLARSKVNGFACKKPGVSTFGRTRAGPERELSTPGVAPIGPSPGIWLAIGECLGGKFSAFEPERIISSSELGTLDGSFNRERPIPRGVKVCCVCFPDCSLLVASSVRAFLVPNLSRAGEELMEEGGEGGGLAVFK